MKNRKIEELNEKPHSKKKKKKKKERKVNDIRPLYKQQYRLMYFCIDTPVGSYPTDRPEINQQNFVSTQIQICQ